MRVPTARAPTPVPPPRAGSSASSSSCSCSLFSLRGLAGFYTDYLWFDSLGQGSTWSSLLAAKVAPGARVHGRVLRDHVREPADRRPAGARSTGRWAPRTSSSRATSRSPARTRAGSASASSLFFALIAGIGVSSQWKQWVLFTHTGSASASRTRSSTRTSASTSSSCRSSSSSLEWLFAGLVIVLHRHRGRALPERRDPVPEPVPAGDAAGEGAPVGDPRGDGAGEDGAVLPRPLRAQLLHRGVVEGASYTDVKAQLPALNLLIVISIVAAGLFIWNIRRRGWVLPIIAVGPVGVRLDRDRHDLPGGDPAVQGRARTSSRPRRRTSTATSARRATRSASTTVNTDDFVQTFSSYDRRTPTRVVDSNKRDDRQRPPVGPEHHPARRTRRSRTCRPTTRSTTSTSTATRSTTRPGRC